MVIYNTTNQKTKKMEEVKSVKTVKVDYKCDVCKDGYMRPTGTCFPTNPPQYPHKCNNSYCDAAKTFNLTYPHIDYRD
jgi:hypothetical protein